MKKQTMLWCSSLLGSLILVLALYALFYAYEAVVFYKSARVEPADTSFYHPDFWAAISRFIRGLYGRHIPRWLVLASYTLPIFSFYSMLSFWKISVGRASVWTFSLLPIIGYRRWYPPWISLCSFRWAFSASCHGNMWLILPWLSVWLRKPVSLSSWYFWLGWSWLTY